MGRDRCSLCDWLQPHNGIDYHGACAINNRQRIRHDIGRICDGAPHLPLGHCIWTLVHWSVVRSQWKKAYPTRLELDLGMVETSGV